MVKIVKFWVAGMLLAGVVLVSSGFAVVPGAKTVAKPGGVCGSVGATVVAKNVSLVCKKTVSGKLVWRVAKASTATTVVPTATTATTTSTTAPKVAVVAPRVVSASSATGSAVITIADMSPDTGVYAVQWVLSGQDFNSYQMYRTTTKTMTVPYLSCTRTYTLRVFVMQENWQMTNSFVNQNVTPHSATFDLTMPACTATAAAATTTTVTITCATGGTCIVGDTGPGGGKVFYVRASGGTFTSTGSDCGTTCKYLEAATSDQSTGIVWATTAAVCYNSGSTTATNDCQLNSVYSGDSTAQAASRTAAAAIGKGMANTNQVYARLTLADVASSTYAAGIAYAYANSGKTDWHLPSKDELNQMCKWQRGVAWVSDATVCTGGTLNSGRGASGFSTGYYWSSSEYAASNAWSQVFDDGYQGSHQTKNDSRSVRPVRAFG